MIVDACKIVQEVSKNINITDYGFNCTSRSNKLLIDFYMESIKCCECYDKPPKCATKTEICDNRVVEPACCNLCIYPDNQYPEGACKASIFPDDTIINVKMISPDNETQCQE